MNHPSLVIGLGVTRQVGKDTLFQRLNALSPRFRRFSAADRLKSDLAPFILERFGIDIWTADGEAKEMIRPLLISYGMCQRERDAGYWIKQVLRQIDDAAEHHPSIIPVVTDVRFPNEASYLSNHYNGAFRLIHLTREGAPSPTDEELKHYPTMKEMADMDLHWGPDTIESQLARAREVCETFGVALNA